MATHSGIRKMIRRGRDWGDQETAQFKLIVVIL